MWSTNRAIYLTLTIMVNPLKHPIKNPGSIVKSQFQKHIFSYLMVRPCSFYGQNHLKNLQISSHKPHKIATIRMNVYNFTRTHVLSSTRGFATPPIVANVDLLNIYKKKKEKGKKKLGRINPKKHKRINQSIKRGPGQFMVHGIYVYGKWVEIPSTSHVPHAC